MLNRSASLAMSTSDLKVSKISKPCLVNLISKDTHLVFFFIVICRELTFTDMLNILSLLDKLMVWHDVHCSSLSRQSVIFYLHFRQLLMNHKSK